MFKKYLMVIACCAVMAGVAQAGTTFELKGSNYEVSSDTGNARIYANGTIQRYHQNGTTGSPSFNPTYGWMSNPYGGGAAYAWGASGNVLNITQGTNYTNGTNGTGTHTITGSGNTVNITGGTISGTGLNLGAGAKLNVSAGGSSVTTITAGAASNVAVSGTGSLSGTVTASGGGHTVGVSGSGIINGTVNANGGNSNLNVSGGTLNGTLNASGGTNHVAISNGTVAGTGRINANGGNSDITVSNTGSVANGAQLSANGTGNEVNLNGGAMAGTVTLGTSGMSGNGNQTINLQGGTNTGSITAHGNANHINLISGNNNATTIRTTGSNNDITFTNGTNSGAITAEGGTNTVTINNGTNSGAINLGYGNNKVYIHNGTNSNVITATGNSNLLDIDGGTNTADKNFNGSNNTVYIHGGSYDGGTIKLAGGNNDIDITAGSINSTGKILAQGGNNAIYVSGTGVLATGSEITATGGSNTVKLDGQSTDGKISLGKTGTLGDNTINVASGTNSGEIVAEGDKNTVNISGGINSSDITLNGDEQTINITSGANNADNIVATGNKNKINISGGTNNQGSIDARGNENELTISDGATSTKIDLGSNAAGEGKNQISIAGGTNSGDIDADGGLNIVKITNGTNSGNITAGLQNNGRGDNQVLIEGGNTSTDIKTAGSNNIYDQKGGTITAASEIDMADGAGERDTHVKIYDNAQMDGTIHAHDGLIEVWTKTANITGDITANHAGADTEWRLSGGNFSSTSHLTSVADGNAKNIFTISRDANLNNTTDAIHTTGTGTTEMTIKEMYQSNTNAISGTIILATDHNVLNLLGGAHITSAGVLDIQGKKSNTITFDLNCTNGGVWTEANIGAAEFANYTFSNLLDLTHPDTINAVNTVYIKSGNLDRGAAGGESIRGAGTGGTTSYHITGGTTRYLNTNGGTGHLYFSNGAINITAPSGNSSQVFNIRDTNIINRETLGTSGTTVEYNTGNYLVYSILNVGETSGATPTGGLVTIKGGATVTLGVMDYNDNDMSDANRYEFAAQSVGSSGTINGGYDYSNHAINDVNGQFEAQISASHVLVEDGGNLIIHENINNWGNAGTLPGSRNLIDDLTIQGGGHVTLDRTSIHGSNGTGSAEVTVSTEGYLHGFGHYTSATNHNPLRANVDGTVTLESGVVDMSTGWVLQRGGTLQPYNADLFQLGSGEKDTDVVKKLMGVVFQSSEKIVFNPTSFLSTRMYHNHDAFYDDENNQINIDGGKNKLYYSDSVISKDFDFSSVWTTGSVDTPLSTSLESKIAQAHKVQYDPVFGFDYELKSKLDFELYQGLPDSNIQTYYYRVASADNPIDALRVDGDPGKALMPDANHLFNRMILKSDMLGEWTFLYTEDEKDIILRFRLLADHPQNGGFVIDETERNNILVGKYLDEIRYPFLTNSDLLNLPGDYAGDIAGLPEDPTMHLRGPDGKVDKDLLEYGGSGYSGNMAEWYRDPATRPAAATNWRDEWMLDWEDMLMGIQLDIQSGADMRRGLRMMHAEAYANVSSSNFNVMSQFIRNRERNAISALYQVEANLHKKAEDDGIIMKDGMEWHVPIIEQEELPFVENPIRFWASGFGQSGYVRNTGSEYGYDLESWGGALGVIKEFRNFYGGLTIGYSDSKSTWENLPSAGKTKSYMAEALVGMHFWDRYFVEGYFDYAYSEQSMNRSVNFGNGYYTGWATGDFNDHTYAGGVRLGFQSVLLDNYVFVATAGAQIMHYTNNGFTEYGRENMASLLKIKKGTMDRTIFKTPVTVRLSRPFGIGGYVLTPEIRASFSPYFGDREGIVVAEWSGNPFPERTFNSYGTKHGKYEAEIGGTIELSRRGRFYVAGNYDLTYTKNSILHNYSLQAGLNF